MPPQRPTSSRRGLVWLVLVLAAGAFTLYKAVGGGGSTTTTTTTTTLAERREGPSGDGSWPPGGGGIRGRGDGGKGGTADGKPSGRVDPKGGDAVPGGRKSERMGKGERGAAAPGPAMEETDGGGFSLKVGQVSVRASKSLDFSTEDQVPGLMWLPTGLKDVATGDPWVTMCLVDYKHYQDNPSTTPMFAHLNSMSKCGMRRKDDVVSAGMVAVMRMSSLLKSMEEEGRTPLPPKGFVYHETRCGSTLVANMLAALPPSRVFSESKPPTQAIRECMTEGCGRELLLKVLRDVVTLMGRRRNDEQHQHLYFKFQNSKFLPEISEAYPEVPWIFVFRDPVEVMVSNLKSLAGAPCVRIPRQEKLRKKGKISKRPTGKAAPGKTKGGLVGGPGMESLKQRLREQQQQQQQGRESGGDGAWGGGDRRMERRLAAAGGAVDGGVGGVGGSALAVGAVEGVGSSFLPLEEGSVVLWEDGRAGVAEEEGDCDPFHSESWNGDYGGDDSCSPPAGAGAFASAGVEFAFAEEGEGERWRRMLASKRAAQQLTMNMTIECSDWLKSMCDSALVAEKKAPSKALFVDYANLPDAVPEFVFPEHFGMAAEVAETVPDWKEAMFKAAGTYSKGLGKSRAKQFTNDVEAKHQSASPLIVEVSEADGGLYDTYRSLDAKQTWRKPETEEGSETSSADSGKPS